MAKQIKPFLYFSAGLLTTALAVFCFSFNTVNNAADGRSSGYRWYMPEMPGSITFSGENVPLQRQDIKEQLEREVLNNYYNANSTLYILKLSYRYFPIIEARLKANGVPDDFKYLCVAESALQNQTSRAGAIGFWQFMKDSAPRFGIIINDEVDERYSITKSTDAACAYFKTAYAKFGTWTAAAASYNCGMGGYDNQATYQQTKDYYNLLLPDETMRYMFRIIAFKYLMTQAGPMGFLLRADDGYKPYKAHTETVTASIPDLAQWAIDKGFTYRTLKVLNPWLRAHTLTVAAGQSFDVLVPDDARK